MATAPWDRFVTISGQVYDSNWFRTPRYGTAGVNSKYPGWDVAPEGAVTAHDFAKRLVQEQYLFLSGGSLSYAVTWETDGPTSPSEWASAPPPSRYYWDPTYHSALWSDVCKRAGLSSGRSDNASAKGYDLYGFAETSAIASRVVSHVGGTGSNGALVIAVDGSGSFSSGSEAVGEIRNLLTDIGTQWPGNQCELVVSKFTDYPPPYQGLYDIPGLLVGTWTGIHGGLGDPVVNALLATNTGGGADAPESYLEGMNVGMNGVSPSRTGKKAILLYTDYPGVFPVGGVAYGRLRVNIGSIDNPEWKFANPDPGENNGRGRLKVKRKRGWVNASGTQGL